MKLRGTEAELKGQTIQDLEELIAVMEEVRAVPDWQQDTAKFMIQLMNLYENKTRAYFTVMNLYVEHTTSHTMMYQVSIYMGRI